MTPTQCIYVFGVILTKSIDYIPKQHQRTGLCNGDRISFLCDGKWNFTWIIIYINFIL